ncbi:hypothetical protein N0V87_009066 [Didymella glomerata]|uniref:Amidohydrolase-related domain-containing protein n=1 Tax=Didymella glomerata TaxID=749621 RepID=A0A9W8WSF5_9PLEO|nr:hypothetical protein N0V87_009066 [Didymella glomerata]
MRVKQFNPLIYYPNPFEDWVMQTFDELADKGPFGEGRVKLGFAFDLFFLPPEMIKSLFAQVKNKGVKTITCHGSVSLGNIVKSLHDLGLLDESIIISHGGVIRSADAELIKTAGAHLSSTPSSELQMAMGRPYCFDASFIDGGATGDAIGLQDNASLGVDCHTITGGSILTEARIALQNARHIFNEYYMKQGRVPRTVPENLSVEAAFNLATIKGAEAANMSNEVGLASIILHSTPADIDTVIVDGIIRKEGGKLLPVSVDGAARQVTGETILDWTTVARKVVSSRANMQEEIDKIEFVEASNALHKLFYVDESRIVDV